MPRGHEDGLVPCGQILVREVLPAESTCVLESLQSPFLEGGRRGGVRGAHPVHEPVRSELELTLGHGQVMSDDQVGDDFAFTLKLRRVERKALALIQRGLDLPTNHH